MSPRPPSDGWQPPAEWLHDRTPGAERLEVARYHLPLLPPPERYMAFPTLDVESPVAAMERDQRARLAAMDRDAQRASCLFFVALVFSLTFGAALWLGARYGPPLARPLVVALVVVTLATGARWWRLEQRFLRLERACAALRRLL